MLSRRRSIFSTLSVAIVTVAAAFYATNSVGELGSRIPFALFFGAVAVSGWYGGLFGGLVASIFSIVLTAIFIFPPTGEFFVYWNDFSLLLVLFAVAGLISFLNEARHRAVSSLAEQHNWLTVTLASIADAVIATDGKGHVRFMNRVGEELVEIPRRQAIGRPLTEVFSVSDSVSGALLRNPVEQVLETGEETAISRQLLMRKKDGTELYIEYRASPIRDKQGKVLGAVLIFRDISKRIENERRLLEAQRQTDAIVNAIPDILIRLRSDGTFLDVRTQDKSQLYTTEDALGKKLHEVMPSDFSDRVISYISKTLETKTLQVFEYQLKIAGILQDYEARMVVSGEDEVVSIIRNATGRKRVENALRDQTERLAILNRTGLLLSAELDQEKLLQAITDAGTDLSGAKYGAFFYNTADHKGEGYMLYTLSGVSKEMVDGFPMPRNTALFGPTFRGESAVRIDDVLKDPRYGKSAPYHGLPSGHFPVRSYLAVPVHSRSGNVLGGLFFGHPEPGVFTENAERLIVGLASQAAIAIDNARLFDETRREREKMESTLKERELLLKEIHHRVKNNLQIISSLLNLQAAYAGEKTADEMLKESQSRIRSMALIHQKLYLSQDLAKIDFGEYLRDLTEMLYQSYGVPKDKITLDLNIQNVQMDIDRAIPCGLIVNELISNSLKHAFPDGRRGAIHVELQTRQDSFVLIVADDGVGMPQSALTQTNRTLGLKLISTLARQLDGRVKTIGKSGTTFEIAFPVHNELN